MDQLRKLLDVARQHYEKIILVVVLLGLAGAVAWIYNDSQKEEQRIQSILQEVQRRPPKPVPPEDLAGFQAVVQRIAKPSEFSLSLPHHLFNPVEWQTNRAAGGIRRIRAEEDIGPERLELLNVRSLTMSIGMGKPVGSGDNITAYQVPYTNQTLPRPVPVPTPTLALNATNTRVPFILREIKGPATAPDEMIFELKDPVQKVSVTPVAPFVRVEAYVADLKYPLERIPPFLGKRVGDVLRFAGKDYKIIEIKSNEVVIVSPKNIPTTVRLKSGP